MDPGVLTAALWVLFIMNTKKGVMSNVLLRRAAQAAINCTDALGAAFGDKSLWTLQGSIYPRGHRVVRCQGAGLQPGQPEKAAALLKQAGYNREPIRILTSVQYDYQYKTAQVIESNLTDAGFKIDLVVTDWATILQRRQNPDQWEAFVTGHGVVPEPSSITVFNPSYPGWWDTPEKHALLDAFTTESDPAKRVPLWHKLAGAVLHRRTDGEDRRRLHDVRRQQTYERILSGHLAGVLEHEAVRLRLRRSRRMTEYLLRRSDRHGRRDVPGRDDRFRDRPCHPG